VEHCARAYRTTDEREYFAPRKRLEALDIEPDAF
jgi:hypothetical protein